MNRKIPVLKTLLIVWLVFSVCYVAWGEWTRFRVFVMQRSYEQGVTDAVTKVIEESKNCKGFPVNVGQASATLVNVDCLKPVETQGAGAAKK